jgi:hypothetical protein
MRDFSSLLVCSAPPFGKGGQGGIHTPHPKANVVKSPLAPLFQRGEENHRALGA